MHTAEIIFLLLLLLIPVGYVFSRAVSRAYFAEKLNYHKSLMNHLDRRV